MCGALNSYVATSTIFVVIEFLFSFFKLVSRPVFVSRQHFCLVIVATLFLVLSEFLSRPRKSVATEFCRHLT